MTPFTKHTAQTAPESARGDLQKIEAVFGAVPNLQAHMAESPELLSGYITLLGLIGKTTLTPTERQVVFMTANFEDDCAYSMAGHTTMAKREGLDPEVIEALRSGKAIPDPKLEALRVFTARVIRSRGSVPHAEQDELLAAGYSHRTVLEVVLAVALKTMSNYTSHLIGIELDPFMAGNEWRKPGVSGE